MSVWVFPVDELKKPQVIEALAHIDRNPSVWYSADGMPPIPLRLAKSRVATRTDPKVRS